MIPELARGILPRYLPQAWLVCFARPRSPTLAIDKQRGGSMPNQNPQEFESRQERASPANQSGERIATKRRTLDYGSAGRFEISELLARTVT